MKLTVQQVFDATPILANIMRENRPLPSKGKYRIARMHRKMQTEWDTIAERYNAMIKTYDHQRRVHEIEKSDGKRVVERVSDEEYAAMSDEAKAKTVMQDAVPDDKLPEFQAKWKELAAEEIDVAIDPIPLDQLCIDGEEGGISIAEFSVLADLVEG